MKRRRFLLFFCFIIAVCACFSLTACGGCNSCDGDKQPVALSVPAVELDGAGVASWEKVPDASGYAYRINGGEDTPTDKTSVQLENGQSVMVKAVGDGVNFTDSAYSEIKTYTVEVIQPVKLSAPEVEIDKNGLAKWQAVPNASGYIYVINNGSEVETASTSVQLSDGDSIKVKAKSDGINYLDGDYSTPQTYTAPPVDPVKLGNVQVTVSRDGVASWTAVANASKYTVKIGDTETQTTAKSKQLSNGQSIQIKAVGDGKNYLDGDYCEVKTYTAPASAFAAPQNLTVEMGVNGTVTLKWDAVDGATAYRYAVNGNGQAVDVSDITATVDLKTLNIAIDDVSFKVMTLDDGNDAIADDGNYSDRKGASGYGDEVEFRILKGNEKVYTVSEIIKISNFYGENLPEDSFIVRGAISANGGGNATLSEENKNFTLLGAGLFDFSLAGENTLKGISVTSTGKLAAGGLECASADFEIATANERFAFAANALNGWSALAEGAEHTQDFALPVSLYGAEILWTSDEAAFVIAEDGKVTVTCPLAGEEEIAVYLTAEMFYGADMDDVYDGTLEYLLSLPAKQRIKLDAPKININPNTGLATWTAVENAIGYVYNVSNNYNVPVVFDELIAADEERSVQLEKFYTIRVYALGDGRNYEDSDEVSKTYNYHPETVDPEGTPLTFNFSTMTSTGELANPKVIFGNACGNSSLFVGASGDNIYLGNTQDGGAHKGTGFIRVGTSNYNGRIKLTFSKKVNGVKIKCQAWDDARTEKVQVNGSAEQNAPKNSWGVLTYNFQTAADFAEIITNKRVFILEITVYLAE